MKAITLHQPWATFTALELKSIETRTHSRFASLVGQRIAIHAAKKVDISDRWNGYLQAALDRRQRPTYDEPYALRKWIYEQARLWKMMSAARGAILCTAYVQEHRRLSVKDSFFALCDCSPDHKGNPLYGLILSDVIRLEKPVLWRGYQGIFNVPDEALKL
jgi:hypothetical protein